MLCFKKTVFIVFLLLHLNVFAQEQHTSPEIKAVKMVEGLKEIKKAKKYFEKTSRPLHVFFDGINGKDYYVKAARYADKGEDMAFTYYWFLVNPKKNTIRYWDVASDKSVSIAEWRRNNHKIVPPKNKEAAQH